jgi:hypothetical protein
MKINLILFFSFTLSIIALTGCKENINGPDSLPPFERWKSYEIHNYRIEQTRFCFCGDGGQRVQLTVLADTIFSVVRVSDSDTLHYPLAKYYLTIDSLFGIIRNNKKDSLVVTYDPVYSYPAVLDINPQLNPLDAGIAFKTSSFQILE